MDGIAFQLRVENAPYKGVLSGAHAKLVLAALGQHPAGIGQSLEGLVLNQL